jgi:hypothetical protein
VTGRNFKSHSYCNVFRDGSLCWLHTNKRLQGAARQSGADLFDILVSHSGVTDDVIGWVVTDVSEDRDAFEMSGAVQCHCVIS